MSEPESAMSANAPAPRDDAGRSWGFPVFARDFPRHPELDALVAAFARGDYATVRTGAPKLATSTDDEAVKRAAELLRARIEPDKSARVLFALSAALLVILTGWWVLHDGPEAHDTPRPPVSHPK